MSTNRDFTKLEELGIDFGIRHCTQCNQVKPKEEFVKKANSPRFYSWCRDCFNQHGRDLKQRNPEAYKKKVRKNTLKRRYNLTEEEYQNLLDSQNGTCAICKEIPVRFVIDHDHSSGKVRGLLCDNCNLSVGWYENNSNRISQIIEYLNMLP